MKKEAKRLAKQAEYARNAEVLQELVFVIKHVGEHEARELFTVTRKACFKSRIKSRAKPGYLTYDTEKGLGYLSA